MPPFPTCTYISLIYEGYFKNNCGQNGEVWTIWVPKKVKRMSPESGAICRGGREGRGVRKSRFLWMYSFCYGTRIKRGEIHFRWTENSICFDSWVQTACTSVVSKLTCPSSSPTLQTSDLFLKQQPLNCTSLLPNIFKKNHKHLRFVLLPWILSHSTSKSAWWAFQGAS